MITAITIHRIAIPFTTGGTQIGMRAGLRAWDRMECLAVQVETSDGLAGWGRRSGTW